MAGLKAVKRRNRGEFPRFEHGRGSPSRRKFTAGANFQRELSATTRTFSHLSQIFCSIYHFWAFFRNRSAIETRFIPFIVPESWKWGLTTISRLKGFWSNHFGEERKKDGKRPKNFPSSPSCLPASLFTQVLRTNSFQQLLSCSEQCQRNLPKLVFSDESSKRHSSALPSCFRFHVRERMSEDDSCEAKFCPKLIY